VPSLPPPLPAAGLPAVPRPEEPAVELTLPETPALWPLPAAAEAPALLPAAVLPPSAAPDTPDAPDASDAPDAPARAGAPSLIAAVPAGPRALPVAEPLAPALALPAALAVELVPALPTTALSPAAGSLAQALNPHTSANTQRRLAL